MMFKVNVLATLLVVGLGVAGVSAATSTPPACVIGCAAEEPQPADLAAICPAESMQICLKDACDPAVYDDAEAHFVSVCKEKGLDVAKEVSASASASASKTSSATGSATATSTSEPSGSASPSGSADLNSGAGRIGAPVCVMLAAMAVFVLG